MSFIELPSGANNSKQAVISLWFRIPGSTIAAAKAANTNGDPAPFSHGDAGVTTDPCVIPLITFGPPTKINKYQPNDPGVPIGGYATANWQVGSDPDTMTRVFNIIPDSVSTIFGYSGGFSPVEGTIDGPPSYIGIACGGDYPVLDVNIVMPKDNLADMDGGSNYAVGSSVACSDSAGRYFGQVENCMAVTGGPLSAQFTFTFVSEHSDAQVTIGATPETFRTCYMGGVDVERKYTGPEITSDQWHHLLLSFDFSEKISLAGGFIAADALMPCEPTTGECGQAVNSLSDTKGTVSRACKMYIALDDINLTDSALTAYRGTGCGPNDIITVNGFAMLSDTGYDSILRECVKFGRREVLHTVIATPTFSYSADAVPFSGGSVCCPAGPDYVDWVRHVEMAELQIFTGVSAPTDDDSVRRAFITDKGKPANMGKAKKLFEMDPDVKLHFSRNWKKPRNTGAIKEIGYATGEIDTYKPDPNLYGKQGDAQ